MKYFFVHCFFLQILPLTKLLNNNSWILIKYNPYNFTATEILFEVIITVVFPV